MQTAGMRTLLLTFGLSLVAAVQAQDPLTSASEEQDILGKWYVKAVAGMKGFPVEKLPPITFSVLDGGKMQASLLHTVHGRCLEVKSILEKTDVPGQYHFWPSTIGATGYLHVEASSVKDHCLTYSEGRFKGESFKIAKLMGRSPEENLEALEEFKKFTQRKGLWEENIILTKQTGSCIPEQH